MEANEAQVDSSIELSEHSDRPVQQVDQRSAFSVACHLNLLDHAEFSVDPTAERQDSPFLSPVSTHHLDLIVGISSYSLPRHRSSFEMREPMEISVTFSSSHLHWPCHGSMSRDDAQPFLARHSFPVDSFHSEVYLQYREDQVRMCVCVNEQRPARSEAAELTLIIGELLLSMEGSFRTKGGLMSSECFSARVHRFFTRLDVDHDDLRRETKGSGEAFVVHQNNARRKPSEVSILSLEHWN